MVDHLHRRLSDGRDATHNDDNHNDYDYDYDYDSTHDNDNNDNNHAAHDNDDHNIRTDHNHNDDNSAHDNDDDTGTGQLVIVEFVINVGPGFAIVVHAVGHQHTSVVVNTVGDDNSRRDSIDDGRAIGIDHTTAQPADEHHRVNRRPALALVPR